MGIRYPDYSWAASGPGLAQDTHVHFQVTLKGPLVSSGAAALEMTVGGTLTPVLKPPTPEIEDFLLPSQHKGLAWVLALW